MSDEKDTAVSPDAAEEQPDVTEEEVQKDQEEKVEKKPIPPRPTDYILVNHTMRSAHTGMKRRQRAGNRRQGVILDNGQRIRRRGYRMWNEVHLRTLVECHQRFLDYLEAGIIEVRDPKTSEPMTFEQVVAKIEEVGSRRTPGEGKLKVDWSPAAIEPELQDVTQPNMEVAKELAQTPEATGEEEETPPETEKEETSETEHETESESDEEEEVLGDEEPEDDISEEELMKKTRPELNALALEYGVENPESFSKKQDVVDAIFEAQGAGEEG